MIKKTTYFGTGSGSMKAKELHFHANWSQLFFVVGILVRSLVSRAVWFVQENELKGRGEFRKDKNNVKLNDPGPHKLAMPL